MKKVSGRRKRDRKATLARIFEASLQLIEEVGLEEIRADELAKRAGVSRTLLNHYFPKNQRRGLHDFILGEILRLFSNHVDAAMKGDELSIDRYIRAHFDWVTRFNQQMSVLLTYFPRCMRDPGSRRENTQSVIAGHKRIEVMFRLKGIKSAAERARFFQILLTGALISVATEEEWRPELDPERMLLDYVASIAR